MDNIIVEGFDCRSLDEEIAKVRELLADGRPVQLIGTRHGLIAVWNPETTTLVTLDAPRDPVPNLTIAEIIAAMIAHLAATSEGTPLAGQTALTRRLGCSHTDIAGWQRGRSYPARTFYPQLLKIAVEAQLDTGIIARLEELTSEIMAAPPPARGPIWT